MTSGRAGCRGVGRLVAGLGCGDAGSWGLRRAFGQRRGDERFVAFGTAGDVDPGESLYFINHGFFGGRGGWFGVQICPDDFEGWLFVGVGEKAVEADFDKARRRRPSGRR